MNDSRWRFYVLGCRGSWPVFGPEYLEFGGSTSCYVLKKDDYAIIIDCGTGLNNAKELLKDCTQIDVLLSHAHYDHLMGLLNWSVFPDTAMLRFIAPFELWGEGNIINIFLKAPFWPYTPDMPGFVSAKPGERIQLDRDLNVRFLISGHPNGGCMMRIEGRDIAICYACDYEHTNPIPYDFGSGCGLLIYDAMFTPSEYPEHIGWGHSTWREGLRTAKYLGYPYLLLSHHNPSRSDADMKELEHELCDFSGCASFAREGDIFEIKDCCVRLVNRRLPLQRKKFDVVKEPIFTVEEVFV